MLSATDPVRTFQEFATIDLISNGRAEIVAGRGSFGEAYPLFGFAMEDYDALEWVDWFNNRRLLEPIGNIPPAEAEANFYADLETEAMAA